jgi:copper chaperone CopZ
MHEKTLQIENLKCQGCARTVRNGLMGIEGIQTADVDLEKSEVNFTFSDISSEQEVIKKLSSLGYPLKGENNDLMKKAKSYVSCAVGRMGSDN